MNQLFSKIGLLLSISFIIRVLCGIYSGAADADAGDYTTLAIQMATYNDYSFLIDTSSARQVFQLWLFVLTFVMEIFGAFNLTAIVTISLLGTLAIYFFYKLVSLYWDKKEAMYMAWIFSIMPLIISVYQNPLYDGFMLCVLLASLYYYFNFFQTNQVIQLCIAGILGSMLVFIHPSAYIYLFFIWLLFPFFYERPAKVKMWIMFSVIIGLIPLLQLFAWHHLYGSFYPYQKMYSDWGALSERGYNASGLSIKNVLNYALIFIVSISPLIVLSLIAFVIDIKAQKNILRILASIFLLILVVIFIGFSTPVRFLLALAFMFVFKMNLLKENKFLFLCGVIAIVMLSLFIYSAGLMAPQKRGFIYIITFSIPILWVYGKKLIRNQAKLFSITIGFYLFMLLMALIFTLPVNENKEFPYFNKKISVALNAYLPYNKQKSDVLLSLQKAQDCKIKSTDFIITNFWGRFIPANLNMPQNHCLIAKGESYSLDKGFEEITLNYYLGWIKCNKPKMVIWDKQLNNESYHVIDKKGKRMMAFTYTEIDSSLKKLSYKINTVINNRVIIYKIN